MKVSLRQSIIVCTTLANIYCGKYDEKVSGRCLATSSSTFKDSWHNQLLKLTEIACNVKHCWLWFFVFIISFIVPNTLSVNLFCLVNELGSFSTIWKLSVRQLSNHPLCRACGAQVKVSVFHRKFFCTEWLGAIYIVLVKWNIRLHRTRKYLFRWVRFGSSGRCLASSSSTLKVTWHNKALKLTK